MKRTCVAAWVVVLAAMGCAADVSAQRDSQTPPPAPDKSQTPAEAKSPDTPPPAPPAPGVSIDEALDALDRQGDQMKDFTAHVALTETDGLTRDAFTRSGTVRVQRLPNDDARILVVFDTRKAGAKQTKEKIEYLLENGWLTERNDRKKSQVRRQVIKPGEKLDLLKLGEGPFPLPIGQAKEDVKKMFDVEIVPAAPTDPAGAIHGRLKPKAGSQFERRFKRIDVWVDPAAQMPRRIETVDASEQSQDADDQSRQTTDLENVKVNTGLDDADFQLEEVSAKQGWTFFDEPYQE